MCAPPPIKSARPAASSRRPWKAPRIPQGAWTRYRWAYDQDIENVIAKAVLLALVHHDRPGGSIFPSQARLCRMIGNTKGQYPERSIGRAVKWLEKGRLDRPHAPSQSRATHLRPLRDPPSGRKPTGLSVLWITGQRVRGKGERLKGDKKAMKEESSEEGL